MSAETALVLRVCRADMTSHDGFRWPESGPVEAPDWSPVAACGHGLHGWLWGEGDVTASCDVHSLPDARWLVVRVLLADIVDLGGKVKYPRGDVVLCGTASEATLYILTHGGAGRAVIMSIVSGGDRATVSGGDRATVSGGDWATVSGGDWATVSGGYGATVSGGDWATVSGGDWATVSGGYRATVSGGYRAILQLSRWDFSAQRRRIVTGYIGEDGLEPNVFYVLDAAGKFVREVPA